MRLLYLLMAAAVGLGLLTAYLHGLVAALGWVFAGVCLALTLGARREAKGARRRLARERAERAEERTVAAGGGGLPS
jgi:hypothetical protein